MSSAMSYLCPLVILSSLTLPPLALGFLPSPFLARISSADTASVLRRSPPLPRGDESSNPLQPFIVLHGIGDACENEGMRNFVRLLSKLAGGANGTCIEIGDGFKDSWTMRLDRQTDAVCRQVKALRHLSGGFNILGLSQGALIGRALIQTCDFLPKVYSLVSIGGPQAGVASTPNCVVSTICFLIDEILRWGIYSDIAQDNVAPAGYVKIPNMVPTYLKHAKFLPNINNERPDLRNSTYAQKLQGVERVVLVKFSDDTVLFPKETAHFGFFPDGSFDSPIPVQETLLYKEDWIGLRTLDSLGKVDFLTAPGNHLHLTLSMINETIVPYLTG